METSPADVRTAISSTTRMASFKQTSRFGIVFVLVAVVVAMGLLSQGSHPAGAAAAPVTQCNNDTASNVGGQGIRCTVTILNHVDSNGAATAPSAITVTKCTGAAGPIGTGAGTCNTTITSSPEPITLIQQCNGAGNGGGGVVICSVQVTNSFSSAPVSAIGAATVYQCIGSAITGPGAPAICTPANTPGVTSVTAATVGQCNGSGNGGTSVGFVCTVTGASTMTSTLPMNIDQCNGSGNGGGSLVQCTAAVTNQVLAPTPTATQSVSATATTTGTPSATITGTPLATTTGTPSATTTGTPSATLTTTPSATASGTPTATTTGTPAATVTRTPAPGPPATGNTGRSGTGSGSQAALWLLGIATAGAALAFVGAQRRPFARRRS